MPTKSTGGSHYSAEECRLNVEHSVQNLLSLFSLASSRELEDGIDWYPQAERLAIDIANRYELPLDTVIRVAAVLSPKCPWSRNMQAAEWVIRQWLSGCFVPSYDDYVSGKVYLARVPKLDPSRTVLAEDPRISAPPCGGLKANTIKALWILEGYDCLSGPKVLDFYECVRNWRTYLGACIDSHAIQAWFGSFDGGTFGIPPSFYQIVRADYIHAANLVGLSPLQFQAVLWLVKKNRSSHRNRG